MRALCGLFVAQGDLTLSLALHVAFDEYLRAMELLGLTFGHAFLPEDPRFRKWNAHVSPMDALYLWPRQGPISLYRSLTDPFFMLFITGLPKGGSLMTRHFFLSPMLN